MATNYNVQNCIPTEMDARSAMLRVDERRSPTTRHGWNHGTIDNGPRLTESQASAASEAIRAALLAGNWLGAVSAMLAARGEAVNAKGLELIPNSSAPILDEAEADYVVALCDCHLTRTDLVVGAQEIVRLSWWSEEFTEAANDRAKWLLSPKFGTAAKSLGARRDLERTTRRKQFFLEKARNV